MSERNMPLLENDDGVHSPERKTPHKTSSRNGNHSSWTALVPHDIHEPDDQATFESREELMVERRTRLEEVVNEHDSLLREAFHLNKFVYMTSYDPIVARGDNSAAFQKFSEGHSLIDMNDSQASSSRRTRRAQTDRLLSLVGSSPVKPTPLAENGIMGRARSQSLHVSKSSGTKMTSIEDSVFQSKSFKSKGKGKATFHDQQEIHFSNDVFTAPSASTGQSIPWSSSNRSVFPLPGPSTYQGALKSHESRKRRRIDDTSPQVERRLRRWSSATTAPDRQFILAGLHGLNESRESDIPNQSTNNETPTRHKRSSPTKPQKSFSHIKSVKLIVRKPPPPYSHHHQRPAVPTHHSSLSDYLDSFVLIDEKSLTHAQAQECAASEAALLHRIDVARSTGQIISPEDRDALPHIPTLSSLGIGIDRPKPHSSSPDIWDQVIEEVVTRGPHRRSNLRPLAAQVALRVQSHLESRAGIADKARDRARVQEEKRLRALAKSTVKAVVAEWKKVVYHVREEIRREEEAEETRLGHLHLDAILRQSGQLLKTQKDDLYKRDGSSLSRSRSNSEAVSDAEDEDHSEDDSSDEREEGSVDRQVLWDSDDEDSLSQSEGDAFEDVGTEMLLSQNQSFQLDSNDRTLDPDEVHGMSDTIDHTSWSGDLQKMVLSPSPSTEPSDSVKANDYTPPSTPPSEAVTIRPDTLFGSVKSIPADHSGEQGLAAVKDGTDRSDHNEDGTFLGMDLSMQDSVSVRFQLPMIDESNEDRDRSRDDRSQIPAYLKPFAVAPVPSQTDSVIKPPLLLRGVLRPYQQGGLEWLASLHDRNVNGILADEMGLGKTIQTISLLAHLACEKGIWGPHLIVVPTSVLLNWEMEFKKFLPGFKVLSYHGSTKRRKELRQGWNDKHQFNVCITSYTLASRDAHIFKRKAWYYMILDEAHMIKNFKSQRWNILLMFRSFRRLLLTGTPLQNNLTELWALLQFLMSGTDFANLKEFGEWFSNPLEKAIEMGNLLDDDMLQRVSKLHQVLRPYLLRRLKRDVEKELPNKYEHLVLCPLSKRQRFLYDEFMSRAQTRDALQSGVYQKIANILMQLRKVCNHPDLFEVRPIVTSFAMEKSAIADFEIKELLVRRRLLHQAEDNFVNLDFFGLHFIDHEGGSLISATETRRLRATYRLPHIHETLPPVPPMDTRTIEGFTARRTYQQHADEVFRWRHMAYVNDIRCNQLPSYGLETMRAVSQCYKPLLPASALEDCRTTSSSCSSQTEAVSNAVKSYLMRSQDMSSTVERFAFVTPSVVALDMPRIALAGLDRSSNQEEIQDPAFDSSLHQSSVKLQIAFPDPSLLQYDCGKLQRLASLLREKKAGGHRILIFTQMTRILDILEIFLNFHGYLYLRLDGATKIEDRQYITERFNADPRVFCFIASSRSGGVGINLTGADTVIFYDSDFNPQMDRQCEDRAHRIGQIRDVNIYRFVSQYTVEEAMLRKANQKRSLDNIVIQKGQFDWSSFFGSDDNDTALTQALEEFDDTVDAQAAVAATKEADILEHADQADFDDNDNPTGPTTEENDGVGRFRSGEDANDTAIAEDGDADQGEEEEEDEGETVVEYMLSFVKNDWEFFQDWRV